MEYLYDCFGGFDRHQLLSSFLMLFAALNMPGNVPVIINIKNRLGGILQVRKITAATAGIMLTFLFVGQFLLDLFSIDQASFAVAGSIVLFLIGIEMILGLSLFQVSAHDERSTIVPLAFPIISGTGTLATLLTLKIKYATINILGAVLLNLLLIYTTLQYAEQIEARMGKAGVAIAYKIMGLILLATAVKLVRTYLFVAL